MATKTGMPTVDEGYSWEVVKTYNDEYEVKLKRAMMVTRRKLRPTHNGFSRWCIEVLDEMGFNVRVPVVGIELDVVWSKTVVLTSDLINAYDIYNTALGTWADYQKSLERAKAEEKYVGTYPPKVLD